MKCPVEVKESASSGLYYISDFNCCYVCGDMRKETADYIVQAINSHEKLVEAIKSAMRIKDLWYFQSNEPQYFSESEALETMRNMFEQALKEAEKLK